MRRRSLFISNFKNGLALILMLMAIVMTLIIFSIGVGPQYTHEYTASLLDKVERLQSIDESKIVLIGDSNLAFGIDSAKIEEACGMPVVNMGLHGGLGYAFHERMAKINLNEGDIVVVSFINYDDSGLLEDPVLAWITIESHWKLWRLIGIRDIFPLVKAYPTYVRKVLNVFMNGTGNQVPEGVYSRDAFNKYGDVALERKGSIITFEEGMVGIPSVSEECSRRLNKLNQYITKKGACMVISGYPIASGEYTPDKQEYIKFQTELEAKLDAPVISDFTDYFMDQQYFYNSVAHLNSEGATIRTNQLIDDIKQWRNF